jgi:ribosomal-protein-alanine N-acetyltransferase
MYLFETINLLVRDLNAGDFPSFYEMESDPEVLRYTTINPDLSTGTIRRDLLKLVHAYAEPWEGVRVWAVTNRRGDFVGTCALVRKSDDEAEIGYRLSRKCWGKGYGAEICEGLIHYALQILRLSKITAVASQSNVASVKILDRLMHFVRAEYNPDFEDMDRFYELSNDEI